MASEPSAIDGMSCGFTALPESVAGSRARSATLHNKINSSVGMSVCVNGLEQWRGGEKDQ